MTRLVFNLDIRALIFAKIFYKPVLFLFSANDPNLGSDFDPSPQSCTGVSSVGVSASANAVSLLSSEPHSGGSLEDGLLQLEPPLNASDYNFTLDDQENLNDLFDNFPF